MNGSDGVGLLSIYFIECIVCWCLYLTSSFFNYNFLFIIIIISTKALFIDHTMQNVYMVDFQQQRQYKDDCDEKICSQFFSIVHHHMKKRNENFCVLSMYECCDQISSSKNLMSIPFCLFRIKFFFQFIIFDHISFGPDDEIVISIVCVQILFCVVQIVIIITIRFIIIIIMNQRMF